MSLPSSFTASATLGIVLFASPGLFADESKASAESPPAEVRRPKYLSLRYQEDWSGLTGIDLAKSGDPLDRIKYLPLTGDGSVWLSLGGQARSRVETWHEFGFGGPGERNDTFWLNRFRYHADLHVTDYFRGFIEGKSAFSSDRDLPGGRRTIDVDELDLQNSFVDFTAPLADLGRLTLRPGRQELLFGKERLVSPLDWVNARRTFDGGSAILEVKDWTVTAFYTQLVIVEKYRFNQPDPQTELYGVYSSGKVLDFPMVLDLYFLGLARDQAANLSGFNGTTGREDRYTAGGRLEGDIARTALDYEVEGAYQFGGVGPGDVDAFMVASQLGYRFATLPARPRLYLGFDYASGDGSPGGDVNTFNQLFPLGHAFFGYVDTIGRQNIGDASTGLAVEPFEKIRVELDGHYFFRADTSDAVYDAAGAVVRPGAAGSSNDVGGEIDLTVKYTFDRHILVIAGYSHFFPGRFIEESGSSEGIDFGYLTLQYTF